MNPKNDWLQALRALAALAVLFFHMAPHWALSPHLAPAQAWMHWGFSGVDVFFVLSGFVVYQTADKPGYSARRFLLRRGLRIYLGYWPVLLLTATLAWAASAWPPLGKAVRSALLLSPSLFDNWVPTAWSLTYELYFYLWIALVFLFAPRWRPSAMLAAFAALLLWNAAWYFWRYPTVQAGLQPARFALTGLGLEFLAGALWAHLRKRHACLHAAAYAKWLALAGACCIVYGLGMGSQSPMYDRIEFMRAATFGVAGFGFLLVALAFSDWQWRAPRPLVALGDASYALYLLHPLLLDQSSHLRVRLPAGSLLALDAFLLALPVAISAISLLWFRWIEWPLFNRAAASGWARRLTGHPAR